MAQAHFSLQALWHKLLQGYFFGSSRKVGDSRTQGRKSEIANQGKEVVIVSIAIADTLGNFDFIVEALQFARADRENGMGSKTIQT